MSKIDAGEYAFAETMKPADIKEPLKVTIKSVESVKTQYGDKRVMTFELDGEDKQVFLNGISIRNLVSGHGDETDKWIGKDVTIEVVANEFTQGKQAVVVTV